MEKFNLNPIIENIVNVVESHKIDIGKYSRWIWQNEEMDRDLGVTAFGCADAANILYTINRFPKKTNERAKWIEALQNIQDEKTGMFYEDTHLRTHVTAHCTAALELFDALPRYPFKDIEKYTDPVAMCELMEGLSWSDARGPGHIAPPIYSAFVITNRVDNMWVKTYFEWLDKNNDPEVGLWRKGTYPTQGSICSHMGDGFHFLFTYEHAKLPYPNVEKLIDTCLLMYQEGNVYPKFGEQFHFIEMDWVFCLNRASRQTKHRFDEIKKTLIDFAKGYVKWLNSVDWECDDGANDLHMLFGTLCCLAELQLALPGVIHTDVPLRMVLDRRPFI